MRALGILTTMLYIAINCRIYDPLNVMPTLNNPYLHVIGGNIDKSLSDDASRILRLIRFKHQLNKLIPLEYLESMKKHADKLTTLRWGVYAGNVKSLFTDCPTIAINNLNFLISHKLIAFSFSHQ